MIGLILVTLIYYFIQPQKLYYPDSIRYEMGYKQHYPFNLRLIRLGDFSIFIPVLTAVYLMYYLPEQQAIFGGYLVLGLSGIFRQNVVGHKLIDSFAIVTGLASVICFNQGAYVLAFIFLIVSSLTKETMPVFIALWSMSFIPLVGLVVPLVVYLINPPAEKDILGEQHQKWLENPLSVFKTFHLPSLVSPVYTLTWGVCLGAILYQGQYWLWLIAGVAIAYSQILVATDRTRLFQYSFPLVILATCSVVEFSWLLVALHIFNPFQFIEKGWTKEQYLEVKKQVNANTNS